MKAILLLIIALVAAVSAEVFLNEKFGSDWDKKWVKSTSKSDLGAWGLSAGKFGVRKGIQTTQDARFYAISAPLDKAFSNKDKNLVIQFTVKHEQGIDCGGGYLKLFPSSLKPTELNGDSQYNIMFGPDICGATRKIHLIFNYKGNNLLWKKQPLCESDKLTHIYTAIIKPDNTYEVLVDGVKKESGSLFDDWEFLPPKSIPDPSAKKPADWVDEKEIDDPEDKKPADWDDAPETIEDPEATKPEDWNDEEDGVWEKPRIPNPEYKGEWKAKRIPNPAYKGEWAAPLIDNPDYFEDKEVYKYEDNAFVGFDLWQVKSGTIFNDVLITDDIDFAKSEADKILEEMKTEKEKFEKEEEERRKKEEEERKKIEEERKKIEEEKKAEEKSEEASDENEKEKEELIETLKKKADSDIKDEL